jgi:hypothetical protein
MPLIDFSATPHQGLVYWDVFKTAKLEDLRPRAPSADDANAALALRAPGGRRGAGAASAPVGASKGARVQHSTHGASKMPPSFMVLSDKEARLMAYLRDYARVFRELYPHRQGRRAGSPPLPLAQVMLDEGELLSCDGSLVHAFGGSDDSGVLTAPAAWAC